MDAVMTPERMLTVEARSACIYMLTKIKVAADKGIITPAAARATIEALSDQIPGLDQEDASTTAGMAWQMLCSGRIVIAPRDRNMNKAFRGKWMVSEQYEPGHMQMDGGGGVWCIVGNDLAALISTAYDIFEEGAI